MTCSYLSPKAPGEPPLGRARTTLAQTASSKSATPLDLTEDVGASEAWGENGGGVGVGLGSVAG